MRLSLLGKNKKILLVGEGNFSFAVTLLKYNLNIDLTASCFENNINEISKKNTDILKRCGVQVFLGVDATKLEEHKILSKENFDIVIFNFPHVGGKMRIEKNRELLRKFFMSIRAVLKSDGEIFLTLCDGQGGTPADKDIRYWHDSWQVTEMAAHGRFILVAVEPFDSSLFESYTVTGYRSLEKRFNTQGSLTHIFKLSEKPTIDNIAPKEKIDLKMYDNVVNWQNIISDISNISNISNDYNLSLYPKSYTFDITLPITSGFNIIKFYETLYNFAGLVISNVELLRYYKFYKLKETITFRITYESKKFPLYRKLTIDLHENVIPKIINKYLNIFVPS
ncbi:PREDICTED: ferredoxin-fold anticodon-binding domain-containing protein 1 homolog [Ceratosolen solmsi marchali]|uniref:Ferredoxin-fold anticodon-binding domain-containing protein 1 homolog n=1 Tax=Ceratosolen solmsi marchali TaxID=326594 RepID=A0AAJ6YUK5_9HYME|nr:PREDICTED: ferredoxin-fold anticodon-binding domain-containing protein 1 homolog [Ceratosolen solmsi marchali]